MLKQLKNRKLLMSLMQKFLLIILIIILFMTGNNLFFIEKIKESFYKQSDYDLNYGANYIEYQISALYRILYSYSKSAETLYFSNLKKLQFNYANSKQVQTLINSIKQDITSNQEVTNIFLYFDKIDLVIDFTGSSTLETMEKRFSKNERLYFFSEENPNQKEFFMKHLRKTAQPQMILTPDYHFVYQKIGSYTVLIQTSNPVINKQLASRLSPDYIHFTAADANGNIYAANTDSNTKAPSFSKQNSNQYYKLVKPNRNYQMTYTAFFDKQLYSSNLTNINIFTIVICILLLTGVTFILYSLKRSLYNPLENLLPKHLLPQDGSMIDEYKIIADHLHQYHSITQEYEAIRKNIDDELESTTISRLLANMDNPDQSLHSHSLQQPYCILSISIERTDGQSAKEELALFEQRLKQLYHTVPILSMSYTHVYLIYIKRNGKPLMELKRLTDFFISFFVVSGLSETFDDISFVRKAYSHSQKALMNTLLDAQGKALQAVTPYQHQSSAEQLFPLTPELESKLANSMLSSNHLELDAAFQEIAAILEGTTLGQQRKCLLRLYDFLCVFLANKQIPSDEFFEDAGQSLEEVILNTCNMHLLLELLSSCYQKYLLLCGEGSGNLLNTIIKFIDENIDQNISLQQLADEMNFSYAYMGRYFKSKMNMSFVEYVQIKKIKTAQELLLNTTLNVVDIAEKTGFNTANTFFRTFKKVTGLTPNEFRNN